MFVKPVPGRRVRYPGDPSRLLPDEGAEVPDRDLFWRRRLKQGDVVLVTTDTTTAGTETAGDTTNAGTSASAVAKAEVTGKGDET
ncbi:DUF2635 domain-containing protein [Escherichia coli]|nr:DUF2635 domain-containing protein [Escherichia coli]EHM4561328.1 DUF2635 domain-containing protein [Escherichia coli]EIC3243775.1 DUF2635 domain-containing protein [Escherichia coli]EIM3170922.1 DUF2635 domain-containing protein [Escherichia coli]EIM3171039.1 DUF2635 domain-containing protein [Escherichia coli]